MNINYIVGHKSPDTDSIISAIVLARVMSSQNPQDSYLPARSGDPNKETKYLLDRFSLTLPEIIPAGEKRVVLVDHNEPDQIHENIKHEEVVAIYDHHKLGGLTTVAPIDGIFETVGAAATVVTGIAIDSGIEFSKNEAGALIGAIISDTIKFSSPTTTDKDKEVVEKLNVIAQIDIDELATQMFEAKSDISDIPTEKLVSSDLKVFSMNGQSIGIGVWETVRPEQVMARKDEILLELEKIKRRDGLCSAFYFIIDILNDNSQLLILSEVEKDCAKEAFGQLAVDGIVDLPGIVSRKKQMVPPLEEYFEKVNA